MSQNYYNKGSRTRHYGKSQSSVQNNVNCPSQMINPRQKMPEFDDFTFSDLLIRKPQTRPCRETQSILNNFTTNGKALAQLHTKKSKGKEEIINQGKSYAVSRDDTKLQPFFQIETALPKTHFHQSDNLYQRYHHNYTNVGFYKSRSRTPSHHIFQQPFGLSMTPRPRPRYSYKDHQSFRETTQSPKFQSLSHQKQWDMQKQRKWYSYSRSQNMKLQASKSNSRQQNQKKSQPQPKSKATAAAEDCQQSSSLRHSQCEKNSVFLFNSELSNSYKIQSIFLRKSLKNQRQNCSKNQSIQRSTSNVSSISGCIKKLDIQKSIKGVQLKKNKFERYWIKNKKQDTKEKKHRKVQSSLSKNNSELKSKNKSEVIERRVDKIKAQKKFSERLQPWLQNLEDQHSPMPNISLN